MGIVNFSPKQDGTGDPSPTNIRPIHPGLTIDGIGDIYGGYVDFDNAEVVEEYVRVVGWTQYRQNNGFIAYYADTSNYNTNNWMCNMIGEYGSFSTSNMTKNIIQKERAGTYNYLALDETVNINDLVVVLPLATPATYSLTASQMTQAYNQLVPVSPVMLERRRRIMMQRNPNILYEAWNLSFNGVDEYINTGVYLFTQENINRDFEFIAEGIDAAGSQPNNTIICAKHNGNSYGFLVRIENTNQIKYNGTVYIYPSPGSIVIRRINGVITLNGTNIKNPSIQFTNAVFDWPLVLGCAIDDNGHTFKYKNGTIDHVCVRWL